MFDDAPVPLSAQIAAVEREISYREWVYPRWLAEHKMTQRRADQELAAMRAVLATLRALAQ
jgi:hypothetical protein